MNCRLLIDPPQSGDWNMALDEALLNEAAEPGLATLRFYEWAEPTLTLGYFQTHADRRRHVASRELPLVRRATGGGALIHHHELTYSLALPPVHPLAADAERLYDAVHGVIVDWLNEQIAENVEASAKLCQRSDQLSRHEQPFLCFQRRSRGDLLIDVGLGGERAVPLPETHDGHFKVCGSAQRRRAGAVLQHGGILLAASPFSPELPGISDLTGWNPTNATIIEQLSRRLASRLRLSISEPCGLASELAIVAGEICESKFRTIDWNRRR